MAIWKGWHRGIEISPTGYSLPCFGRVCSSLDKVADKLGFADQLPGDLCLGSSVPRTDIHQQGVVSATCQYWVKIGSQIVGYINIVARVFCNMRVECFADSQEVHLDTKAVCVFDYQFQQG
ncbi:hypothetical protein [Mesorhizobium sp. CN2-181]|uniref:hypothetical protein n=1 Tax=Mesorhizobium yinganensis TaxID=3157707 RepID=UPI0032B8442D